MQMYNIASRQVCHCHVFGLEKLDLYVATQLLWIHITRVRCSNILTVRSW
jgi:hypothetical protein